MRIRFPSGQIERDSFGRLLAYVYVDDLDFGEVADPSSKTQIAPSIAEEVVLEGSGSGSGASDNSAPVSSATINRRTKRPTSRSCAGCNKNHHPVVCL